MNYQEAIKFLYELQLFGARFNLDGISRLAAALGNPERDLRFIHVAGTNGKGSTCAFLASIYREAGLRCGLYTSPHLVSFGERIQINGEPISQADTAIGLSLIREIIGPWTDTEKPTFFEAVTALALWYFKKQLVELVIWETGLGGRLDATNIVSPLVSVITPIDFDHQNVLGSTLEQIASEKAGIIKTGIPCVTAPQHDAALEVLTKVAQERQSPLVQFKLQKLPAKIHLGLRGVFQEMNALTAIYTVECLQPTIPVSREVSVKGLENARWPGRFQLVRAGERELILDGAHNPSGARALAVTLRLEYPGQRFPFIFASMRDKEWQEVFAILSPLCSQWHLVKLDSPRALEPETALDWLMTQGSLAQVDSSLTAALAATADEPLTVLCGSLYFVGQALLELGLAPTTLGAEELALNNWTAPPKTTT